MKKNSNLAINLLNQEELATTHNRSKRNNSKTPGIQRCRTVGHTTPQPHHGKPPQLTY